MLKPYIFHAEHWHDMALDGNHIQMTWISWPFYCADCACICAGCCFRRWCSATGLRLRLLAQIGSALPERLARCSSVAAFAVLQVKQTAVKNKDILTTSCECFLAFAGLLLYVALQCPAWVVLWVFCLNLRPASKAKKQKAWRNIMNKQQRRQSYHASFTSTCTMPGFPALVSTSREWLVANAETVAFSWLFWYLPTWRQPGSTVLKWMWRSWLDSGKTWSAFTGAIWPDRSWCICMDQNCVGFKKLMVSFLVLLFD